MNILPIVELQKEKKHGLLINKDLFTIQIMGKEAS